MARFSIGCLAHPAIWNRIKPQIIDYFNILKNENEAELSERTQDCFLNLEDPHPRFGYSRVFEISSNTFLTEFLIEKLVSENFVTMEDRLREIQLLEPVERERIARCYNLIYFINLKDGFYYMYREGRALSQSDREKALRKLFPRSLSHDVNINKRFIAEETLEEILKEPLQRKGFLSLYQYGQDGSDSFEVHHIPGEMEDVDDYLIYREREIKLITMRFQRVNPDLTFGFFKQPRDNFYISTGSNWESIYKKIISIKELFEEIIGERMENIIYPTIPNISLDTFLRRNEEFKHTDEEN